MTDPTQSELAALAAKLATGEESTAEDFRWLAERALNLWHGAGEALLIRAERRAVPETLRAGRDAAFLRAGLEPPEAGKRFTLKEALAYLMPKKKTDDRVKKLRDYLKAEIGIDPMAFLQSPEEAGASVEDRANGEMARLRCREFDYGQFCRFAERFLPWLENDISTKRAQAGKTGGGGREAQTEDEREEKKAGAEKTVLSPSGEAKTEFASEALEDASPMR